MFFPKDPLNGRVLLNVEKYEKLLVDSPSMDIATSALKRPSTTYLRTRNIYERLCQTQGSQVHLTSYSVCGLGCQIRH